MLPSFRLVVAAFFCGFLAVSAALHLFASARLAQESSPQLATGVAALPLGGSSAHDWRRDPAATPDMFDPRFAIDATTPAPAPAGLTLHAIHRATGALSEADPEKVALLPDRDSPASVMLPVPAVPASAVAPPAIAPRAPGHVSSGGVALGFLSATDEEFPKEHGGRSHAHVYERRSRQLGARCNAHAAGRHRAPASLVR